MIVFLHTSPIHIPKFEALVRQYNKDIPIKHVVNEDLLKVAVSSGQADADGFKQTIQSIEASDPSLIICTCSTYGALCDSFANVHRIDRPIAEYLVQNFKRIGLAYTAHSTSFVSKQLLQSTAKQYDKTIEIIDCDCTQYWGLFEKDDFISYERGIADTIQTIEYQVNVVFLAQASMQGATAYLNEFSKPIMSSPDFGVKTLLNLL